MRKEKEKNGIYENLIKDILKEKSTDQAGLETVSQFGKLYGSSLFYDASIQDCNVYKAGKILGWKVTHGELINSLQFLYGKTWGNIHGNEDFNLNDPVLKSQVMLNNDEFISTVRIKGGPVIEFIEFTTNLGRVYIYGGTNRSEQDVLYFPRGLAYNYSYIG